MRRGLHRSAVWRWLRDLNRRSGGRLLVSKAPMATTLTLLRRYAPRWLEDGQIARDELQQLKRRVREQELRLSALGARVRELQKVTEALAERLAG